MEHSQKLFRDHQHYEIPGMEKIKQEIDEEIKKINEKIKEYEKDIKEEKEKNREMLVNGKIENFIKIMAELKKVGEKYNIHELIEIYEEGEKRYKYKIPPGYKDITKDKIDDTKTHKYGDLIMWKQLMNQCNEKQKSLLFITNDVKEDWMDEIIQSPRKELVEEFKIECGENLEFTMMDFKTFYMNLSKLNKWNNIKSRVEIEAYDFIEKYLVDNKNEIIKEIEMKINDELLYEVIRIIEDSYGLEIEEFEEHNIKNLQIDDVNIVIDDDNDITYNFLLILTDKTELIKDSNSFGEIEMEIELNIILYGKIKEDQENYTFEEGYFELETISLKAYSDNVDEEELCFICKNKQGDIFYYDNCICDSCASSEGIEICTYCGRAFNYEDTIGGYCKDCFDEID